jgi:hypothetical protein
LLLQLQTMGGSSPRKSCFKNPVIKPDFAKEHIC